MSNNKKIHIRNLIVLIIIIVLIGIGITITMSRYRSEAEASLNVDIAFYVLKDTYQEGNIFLADLYPSTETFDYQFTVANSEGGNIAETSIEYTAELEITTNLPLEFTIYKNGTKLTKAEDIENNIETDETGETYIRKIKIKNGNFNYGVSKVDTYKLEVEFPVKYADYEEFEGMVDNINIEIDSKQKIN